MNSITGLLFILLVCKGVTASGGNGWCCSILNKYPDMIPIQKWGNGVTDSEMINWNAEGCNDRVGGSSKALCTGVKYFQMNEEGSECTQGYTQIMDENECRNAVDVLKDEGDVAQGVFTGSWADHVPGCFEGYGSWNGGPGNGNLHLNQISDSKGSRGYRICKKVTIKSESWDRKLTVTFVNLASTPIDVIWIDYKGKEKVYKYDLAMGAEYTINTYFTHPWVFNSSSDGRTTLLARANGHTSPIFEASSFKAEPDSKLLVEVIDGRYYESYPASQCHTSSNIYPGDKMDNPMFGGGGFFNDGSLMTGHECREACDDASNVDNHGRPCVAYEHSSQNPNDKAKCALAWACESVESWNGGSAYKKIGTYMKGIQSWSKGKASNCKDLGCFYSKNGLQGCHKTCMENDECNLVNFCPAGADCTSGLNRCCPRHCTDGDHKMVKTWKGWDVFEKTTEVGS